VNEIINRKFKVERKDLESYARLLNLMIHFELGNVMVLKYSVENTRRWLRKQQSIQAFERVLLRFFAKISTAARGDYSIHFEQLQTTLFNPDKTLVDANILDYLDFEQWINSHLKRHYAFVS